MKIFKLTVNEAAQEPAVSFSNHIAMRTERKAEFYLSREKAVARQTEIYDGIKALVGYFPRIEAIITEIEVIE